jgi:hypothetical protein
VSDIVAVLVVPADKDPGRLLEPGPCDAMPPVVVSGHLCAHDGHRRWQLRSDFAGDGCYMCHYPLRALPLWWNGALVAEGWDRARRVVLNSAEKLSHHEGMLCGRFHPNLSEVFRVGELAVFAGLATRVVRLTRVDGRLVELEPEVTP